MKLNMSISIITIAFILSLVGFIMSVAMPHSTVADTLMIAALFCAAASGIVASVFTKKLSKSIQWKYVVIGGLLVLLSFPLKIMGFVFINNILKLSGGAIAISGLGYYIYLHKFDYRKSKWIWFVPLILSGCLFKYMYWTGGNIILFGSLLFILVTSIIELFRLENYKGVHTLLLVWQIVMCCCITVFYFRYVKLDYFFIGYIFTWLALVDIFLRHEKNMLQNNEFN